MSPHLRLKIIATWWIETHNLNQFEKAAEIREMVMDL